MGTAHHRADASRQGLPAPGKMTGTQTLRRKAAGDQNETRPKSREERPRWAGTALGNSTAKPIRVAWPDLAACSGAYLANRLRPNPASFQDDGLECRYPIDFALLSSTPQQAPGSSTSRIMGETTVRTRFVAAVSPGASSSAGYSELTTGEWLPSQTTPRSRLPPPMPLRAVPSAMGKCTSHSRHGGVLRKLTLRDRRRICQQV